MSTRHAVHRRRWRRLGASLAFLLATAACDRSSGPATSPSPAPQNVRFTGTMDPSGFTTHGFRATIDGQLTARFDADREMFFILVDTSVGCGPPWAGGCRPLARPPSAGSAELHYPVARGVTYTFAVWRLPEAATSNSYTLDVVLQ